jgi:hypothetical protein
MAIEAIRETRIGIAEGLVGLVAADGSARQLAPLLSGGIKAAHRPGDFADITHYICTLHGGQSSIIDTIAEREKRSELKHWLQSVGHAFEGERDFLLRLAVAAGPIPGTPGQAATDAAVIGQRQALDMLAGSERVGCALGSAIALVLDWSVIRQLLDQIAARFGLRPAACTLPHAPEVIAMTELAAATPAIERALLFGGQQLLAQHRGLWSLLEARRSARAA